MWAARAGDSRLTAVIARRHETAEGAWTHKDLLCPVEIVGSLLKYLKSGGMNPRWKLRRQLGAWLNLYLLNPMDSKRLSVSLSLLLPNLPCALRTSFFQTCSPIFFQKAKRLSIPLPRATMTFHVIFAASTGEGESHIGLALCCVIAGTDVHTLLLSAHTEKYLRLLALRVNLNGREDGSPLSWVSEVLHLSWIRLWVALSCSETSLLLFRERVMLWFSVVMSGWSMVCWQSCSVYLLQK